MNRFLLTLLLLTGIISAQTKPDSTLYKWQPALVTGFNLSQVSFSDWAKGGDNSLAWNAYVRFGLTYETEDWVFKNQLRLLFGRIQVGDGPNKQNENEFFMETVGAREMFAKLKLSVSNTIFTQITTGYDYKVTPEAKVSDFFDPAYITQGIGILFDNSDYVKSRLDLAFREIVTSSYNKESDDPATAEIEKFKFDIGIASVTDLTVPVAHNVQYTSKLSLFSPFKTLDVWDARWENAVTAKFSDWLAVNFDFLLVYMQDQIMKTQIRQGLQIGITYTIF
ncbi:MAG: DUF3078 domain-containing protein [Ignavibacteriaceae bacterium]|nr:DUF3078 domain-containing protein [Ignavibacteriaceae bacterium]